VRGRPSADEVALRQALGLRLRDMRERLGLSVERLAHNASVHPTYLSALERGEHTMSVWTLMRIVTGAGVAPGELLAGLPVGDQPTRPAPT
jgi:transcriptional regulator with XRE-family HTH domain